MLGIRVTGSVEQYDFAKPDAQLTFLSTTIRSPPKDGGFLLDQELFIRYLLKTWELFECKPLLSPREVGCGVELPSEEEKHPDDLRRAQKLAGSLIWLSTRTRPDIADAQSRVSSMSSKHQGKR